VRLELMLGWRVIHYQRKRRRAQERNKVTADEEGGDRNEDKCKMTQTMLRLVAKEFLKTNARMTP
jgi:hypothetical protein